MDLDPGDSEDDFSSSSRPIAASRTLSLSHSVPEAYLQPNHIFDTPSAYYKPQEALDNAHTTVCWRIVLLLVAWLHLTYHLPHRACNLILRILKLILTQFDAFPARESPILTLQSTFRRLRLEDRFLVVPLCPICRRLFIHALPGNATCSDCLTPLFTISGPAPTDSNAPDDYESIENNHSRIILRLPFNPVSRQLADLLQQPGIEKKIDEWRTAERKEGELRDIMDGEIWKTLPGPDGRLFFDNDPNRESKDELRIALTLGVDG